MNRCLPTGKVEYITATEGWNALQKRCSTKARSTHQQIVRGGYVYRCVHCHHGHLTRVTHRHASNYWPLIRNAVRERDLIGREQEREAWA